MINAKGELANGLYNLLYLNNGILYVIKDNVESRALL
jgi:hypothetical protein